MDRAVTFSERKLLHPHHFHAYIPSLEWYELLKKYSSILNMHAMFISIYIPSQAVVRGGGRAYQKFLRTKFYDFQHFPIVTFVGEIFDYCLIWKISWFWFFLGLEPKHLAHLQNVFHLPSVCNVTMKLYSLLHVFTISQCHAIEAYVTCDFYIKLREEWDLKLLNWNSDSIKDDARHKSRAEF